MITRITGGPDYDYTDYGGARFRLHGLPPPLLRAGPRFSAFFPTGLRVRGTGLRVRVKYRNNHLQWCKKQREGSRSGGGWLLPV